MKKAIFLITLCFVMIPLTSLSQIKLPKEGHTGSLSAGMVINPWENLDFIGWQFGGAYHYKASEYALIGPSIYYNRHKGSAKLKDMPMAALPSDYKTELVLNAVRLGMQFLINPTSRMSRMKYMWPYFSGDIGLAIQNVSDVKTDATHITSVSDWSGDLYIKPGVGLLIYPRSKVTIYGEISYLFIPTYKFVYKEFNLFGQPKNRAVNFNTDAFILDIGVFVDF
ncbi:MAG: hypothetical protein N2746_01475 [Deltaproteobacteria bacterium]|nr:hypothetical protein [Deltaproteobacteria bacterium]